MNASLWQRPPQTKTSSWRFRSRAPPPCRQGRRQQWGFSTAATASTSCKKLCSKLLSTAKQTPKKKTNAQAFNPTSWWQLDLLGKLVQCSMGRGSCRMDPLLWGRGEDIDGTRHKKLWRNMALVPPWALYAHSSSVYTKWNKSPLCQSLYLGLPVGLMKHLCTRVCKGDNLEDRLLMP